MKALSLNYHFEQCFNRLSISNEEKNLLKAKESLHLFNYILQSDIEPRWALFNFVGERERFL